MGNCLHFVANRGLGGFVLHNVTFERRSQVIKMCDKRLLYKTSHSYILKRLFHHTTDIPG